MSELAVARQVNRYRMLGGMNFVGAFRGLIRPERGQALIFELRNADTAAARVRIRP